MTEEEKEAINPQLTYASLAASLLDEIHSLTANNNIPKILEQEKSISIQNALKAQQEEIENLRKEAMFNANNETFIINRIQLFSQNFLKKFTEFVDIEMNTFNNMQNQIQESFGRISSFRPKQNNSEVLKYQETISILRAEIENMRMNNKSDDIDILMKQNRNLQNENNSLKTQLQDIQNTLEALQNENNQLRNNNNDQKIQQLTNEIEKCHQVIKDLQTQNEEKSRITSSINEEVQNLHRSINELQSENEQLKAQQSISNSNFSSDLDLKDSIIRSKEAQINQLQQQIDQLKNSSKDSEIKELTQKVQSLISENSQMSISRHELLIELENVKNKLKESEESKSIVNAMNLEMIAKIEDLELEMGHKKSDQDSQGRLNEIQLELNNAKESINVLQTSLSKNRQQYDQQIQIYQQQIQSALEHADSFRQKFIALSTEHSNLKLEFKICDSEKSSIQRNLASSQNKIHELETEINIKDLMIQQIQQQKEEIEEDYENLLQEINQRKSKNEIFITSISHILQCDDEQISEKITKLFEQIIYLKDKCSSYETKMIESEFYKSKSKSLEKQIEVFDKFTKSELEKSILVKEGEESKIVNGIRNDFKQLYEAHSQLIHDHNELQTNFYENSAKLQNLEQKLKNEKNLNEEINIKMKKFDDYQFMYDKIIQMLSNLSQNLIANLSYDDNQHMKIEIIDNLLIELKKKNLSKSEMSEKFDFFEKVVLNELSNDGFDRLERNANSIIQKFNNNFKLILKKIENVENKTDLIQTKLMGKRSITQNLTPTKMKGISYMKRSPMTPATTRSRKGGGVNLTPRLNPPMRYK